MSSAARTPKTPAIAASPNPAWCCKRAANGIWICRARFCSAIPTATGNWQPTAASVTWRSPKASSCESGAVRSPMALLGRLGVGLRGTISAPRSGGRAYFCVLVQQRLSLRGRCLQGRRHRWLPPERHQIFHRALPVPRGGGDGIADVPDQECRDGDLSLWRLSIHSVRIRLRCAVQGSARAAAPRRQRLYPGRRGGPGALYLAHYPPELRHALLPVSG